MTEAPIREPDQIRQNCARKLRSVETMLSPAENGGAGRGKTG